MCLNTSELQVTRIFVKSKVEFKVKLEILRQSLVEVQKSQSVIFKDTKKSQKTVKFIFFRFNSNFFCEQLTDKKFSIQQPIN